jgi:hypothetical protein
MTLRYTKEGFFNIPNYSYMNLDLLKKVLTFKSLYFSGILKTNLDGNYYYMKQLNSLSNYLIFNEVK